jgi:hypothetical protein
MANTAYKKFVKRWEEVTDLPPQTVGPLTPLYKQAVKRLKIMPWPVLVIGAVCIVVGMYILIGSTITLLVSVLQRGF